MANPELPLFTHWESFLKDLFVRTSKFPKHARHTLTNRIENTGLDVMERLIEARWTRAKTCPLRSASLGVEKLRILCRIAHEQSFLDHRGYEYLARGLDEAGRMLGGWLKNAKGR